MQKILYYTSPFFFDLDISLIKHLSARAEVYVLMVVGPHSLKTTAFSLGKQDKRVKIIKASEYPGMEQYASLINLDKWFLLNYTNYKTSLLQDFSLFRQSITFIRNFNPDIIHLNIYTKSAMLLIPFLSSYKKVISIHDPIPHIGDHTVIEKLKRLFVFSYIKEVILLNNSQLPIFKRYYKKHKLSIHVTQISIYECLLKYESGISQYSNYILFFGRISKYKGIEILLKAFLESDSINKNVKLIIAGKGIFDFNKDLYEKNPNIIFLNRFIETDELVTLIKNSKFVVCPYIEATQSGVIMSAFTFCKPVIASRVGGLPDVIQDDINGKLVEPGNSKELAMAIDNLCINPKKLELMAKNIKLHFFENGKCSWEAISDNYLKIYKNI